jgi:hypothetical protein
MGVSRGIVHSYGLPLVHTESHMRLKVGLIKASKTVPIERTLLSDLSADEYWVISEHGRFLAATTCSATRSMTQSSYFVVQTQNLGCNGIGDPTGRTIRSS